MQLILSVKDYYALEQWKEANSDILGIMSLLITYDSLFLFVVVIGLYEMLTKPSRLKTAVRVFLVGVILGTQFSSLIPINSFYFGVYNTAWFVAAVAFVLMLIKLLRYSWNKITS